MKILNVLITETLLAWVRYVFMPVFYDAVNAATRQYVEVFPPLWCKGTVFFETDKYFPLFFIAAFLTAILSFQP